jgi:hypothetical protein
MRKSLLVILVFGLLALCMPVRPVSAASPALPVLPPLCGFTPLPGSLSLICNPGPGKDWIVFAHGYVPEGAPPGTAWLQLTLPGSTTSIPEMVMGLGYGFAASAYNKDGLAIKEGIADTVHLGQYLVSSLGARKVYLIGASEGGLITTLIMEGNGAFMANLTNPFSGAVSACGPTGDFRKQINYFGDFRVLFDYFFPGVLPGNAISVPTAATADWLSPLWGGASSLQSAVTLAVSNPANSGKVSELMRTSRAAYVSGDTATIVTTSLSALNYDVAGFNNAMAVIGLQPYSNQRTFYFGSNNDLKLNSRLFGVGRYGPTTSAGDQAINTALLPYQTTGKLKGVLVSLHTTLDPEVPVWHQTLYRAKVWGSGSAALYNGLPVLRYGHCAFKPEELVFAFYLMVYKASGTAFTSQQVSASLPDAASLEGFRSLQRQNPSAPTLQPGEVK